MSNKLLKRLLIISTFCFGYCEDLLSMDFECIEPGSRECNPLIVDYGKEKDGYQGLYFLFQHNNPEIDMRDCTILIGIHQAGGFLDKSEILSYCKNGSDLNYNSRFQDNISFGDSNLLKVFPDDIYVTEFRRQNYLRYNLMHKFDNGKEFSFMINGHVLDMRNKVSIGYFNRIYTVKEDQFGNFDINYINGKFTKPNFCIEGVRMSLYDIE